MRRPDSFTFRVILFVVASIWAFSSFSGTDELGSSNTNATSTDSTNNPGSRFGVTTGMHRVDVDLLLARPHSVAGAVTSPLVLGNSEQMKEEISRFLKTTYSATYKVNSTNHLVVLYKMVGERRADDKVISTDLK